MNLHQYKSYLFILTIVSAALINSCSPAIDSITPDSGRNTSATEVIINGSNFMQGADVSLFPGGMYLKGSVDLSAVWPLKSAKDIYVSGSYAYVATGSTGLQVIDISAPSSPEIIGSVDTPGYAYAVYVSGSYAYLAKSRGLQVIDISTPSSPAIIGSVDTAGFAVGVYVSGFYAYVVAYKEIFPYIGPSDY